MPHCADPGFFFQVAKHLDDLPWHLPQEVRNVLQLKNYHGIPVTYRMSYHLSEETASCRMPFITVHYVYCRPLGHLSFTPHIIDAPFALARSIPRLFLAPNHYLDFHFVDRLCLLWGLALTAISALNDLAKIRKHLAQLHVDMYFAWGELNVTSNTTWLTNGRY